MEKFPMIDTCFIRKDKKCGKILGGSKSCFIACPSRESVQMQIDIIENKLNSEGIEPYVAVKDSVLGEDIFCTKICGKIIESKFCIVLLDDYPNVINTRSTIYVPNPNVYYEYGFMTALDKQIIPLQRDGDDLAFNIRSFDTIKYKESNLKTKIGQAIKNTIKKIDSKQIKDIDRNLLEKKSFNRKMEINGFRKLKIKPDVDDFDNLQDLFNDTIFSGYYKEDKKILLLLSSSEKINELEEIEDVKLIISRFESRYEKYVQKIKEHNYNIQNNIMFASIQPNINDDQESEYKINRMKEITELRNMFFGIQEKNNERSEKINNKIL